MNLSKIVGDLRFFISMNLLKIALKGFFIGLIFWVVAGLLFSPNQDDQAIIDNYEKQIFLYEEQVSNYERQVVLYKILVDTLKQRLKEECGAII